MDESSDVVVVEKLDEKSIQKSVRAQFAHVVFYNVEESYQVDLDVNCAYRISSELEVGSRDWVGLFKVGWRSQSNYVWYEWSPMPKDYTKGSEVESVVVFAATRLPRDDGEFYQFCYITSDGQVRGASTPFQFRVRSPSDLMEVEEENGELLVIKTKTAVLEEQLKKANDTKLQLKQDVQLLQNDLDLMRQMESGLQKKLKLQKNDHDVFKSRFQETLEVAAKQKEAMRALEDQTVHLQHEIDVLVKEKVAVEEKLADGEKLITSLQKKIKMLANEKDSLIGQNTALEREKEIYLPCFHESEVLKKNLAEAETRCAQAKAEVEKVKSEAEMQRLYIDLLGQGSAADKEMIDDLSERLRNAEDRLQAAEACKLMLNDEVLTMKQAYEQMSVDFQRSKDEVANGRHVLLQREKELNESVELMKQDREVLQLELAVKTQELDDLEQIMTEQEMQSTEMMAHVKQEAEGSLYALQLAHDTLSERFSKLQKRNESVQKTLDQREAQMRELEEANTDQMQEIRCLRDRLFMGQEAYKEKFIECQRMEVQLEKYRRERVATENQMMQTSLCISDQLTSTEMQQQLKDVAIELDDRQEKILKYKRLLMSEKATNDHYARLLADVTAELDRYKGLLKASIFHEEVFDPLESDDSKGIPLHAPLTPLPPPMEPKKLSSPTLVMLEPKKMLNSHGLFADQDVGLNGISNMVESLYHFAPDAMEQGNGGGAAASAAADEERYNCITASSHKFVDAPEEPLHPYPAFFCSPAINAQGEDGAILGGTSSFSPSASVEVDYKCCPICDVKFASNYPDAHFAEHVNSHFDDA